MPAPKRSSKSRKKAKSQSFPLWIPILGAIVLGGALLVAGSVWGYRQLQPTATPKTPDLDAAVAEAIAAHQAFVDGLQPYLKDERFFRKDPFKQASEPPPAGMDNPVFQRMKAMQPLHDRVSKAENALFEIAKESPPTEERIQALIEKHRPALDALAKRIQEFASECSQFRKASDTVMIDVMRIKDVRKQYFTKWEQTFATKPDSRRILDFFKAIDWQPELDDRGAYAWIGRAGRPGILDVMGSGLKDTAEFCRAFTSNQFVQLLLEVSDQDQLEPSFDALQHVFGRRLVLEAHGSQGQNGKNYMFVWAKVYPTEGPDELRPYLKFAEEVLYDSDTKVLLLKAKPGQPPPRGQLIAMPEPLTVSDDFVPWPRNLSRADIKKVVTVCLSSPQFPQGFSQEGFQPWSKTYGPANVSCSLWGGRIYVQFGPSLMVASQAAPLPDVSQVAAMLGTQFGQVVRTVPEKNLIHYQVRGDLSQVLDSLQQQKSPR